MRAATLPFRVNRKKTNSLTRIEHPSFVITAVLVTRSPYDRRALQQFSASYGIEWRFLEFRLTEDNAATAKNACAVCVLDNDQLERSCLEAVEKQPAELVSFRGTGLDTFQHTWISTPPRN